MTKKVGLLVGREWSFPPAFIEEVNRRDEGVTAEYVKLGAPAMDEPCEYAVIVDRISHEVPFYRTYLKQAVLQGCSVVNNPFMWTADDKFFGAALATSLGIAHPKTMVLPNKEYIPGIVHDESLRNLKYPLDWQGIVEYIGLPCILKDAHGGGWKDVYVCRSLEELIHHYDTSGLLTMVVQEFIEWDHFIRCICIGQEVVMPIKYDPRERKYHVEHEHMSPELGERVVADSLKLVRALGYDMNSMEWAVRDGVPYAIDFMNPAPDMDIYSLTPHYFEWAVRAMADMCIRLAKEPRGQVRDLRWDALFTGSRADAPPVGSGTGGRAEGGVISGGLAASNAGPQGSGAGGRSEGVSGIGSEHEFAAAGGGAGVHTGGDASATGGGGGGHTGDATTTGGGGGGHTGEGTTAAGGTTAGDSPIQSIQGSGPGGGEYVDPSPAADLEPPAEASTSPHGQDAAGGSGGGAATAGGSGGGGHTGERASVSGGDGRAFADAASAPGPEPAGGGGGTAEQTGVGVRGAGEGAPGFRLEERISAGPGTAGGRTGENTAPDAAAKSTEEQA